jgi:mannose-1-phosphate guanylyltransferase
MSDPIVPIILAGGKGTRLWPLSREDRPKQFLHWPESPTLFQQALQRIANRDVYCAPIVVTNLEYRFMVAEQASDIGVTISDILLEPVVRNTAAAIAVAAMQAEQHYGPEAILHILPSDHLITIDETYWASLHLGRAAAVTGYLVTFGVTPTSPETSYGYIQTGECLTPGVYRIAQFIEKPRRKAANRLLKSGNVHWNAGMFMFKASAYLEQCAKHAPATLAAARMSFEHAERNEDFVRLNATALSSAPDTSVDYAIMERTDCAVVIPVAYSWSDLGTWGSIYKTSEKQAQRNVTFGPSTLDDVYDSLIISDVIHVVVSGLSNIAVIATGDAVYVSDLNTVHDIRPIVRRLGSDATTAKLTQQHTTHFRPWGGYSSVANGDRFQVKRIFVKPGKSLSLQKHHHRDEHWVIVRGTAEVTLNGVKSIMSENQSVYLPLGSEHRLANPGKIELELIEVQTGSYLEEDDIVRLEDEFGRA